MPRNQGDRQRMEDSMKEFIPLGLDHEILNEIGTWKVLKLRDLYLTLNRPMVYSGFCKRIQKLEQTKLIFALTINKAKYAALTSKGGQLCNHNNYYDMSKDSLIHDLTASMVLRQLLTFENFKSGYIFNDDSLDVKPDALIRAMHQGKDYTLGVEVELTQKSRERITDKFSKYPRQKTFNHVLYIFNKRAAFEFYKRILAGMDDAARPIFILCLYPALSIHSFNHLESECWHRDMPKTFEQIFKSQNGGGE